VAAQRRMRATGIHRHRRRDRAHPRGERRAARAADAAVIRHLIQQEKRVSLINLVVVLIVVGVLLWLVNTYIPMDRKIKSILNAVVVIAVVVWLLQVFGLLGSLASIHVGR
jgi:predicted lysophospholipase L1 biosynthesis ABC-type transport system permease subunit